MRWPARCAAGWTNEYWPGIDSAGFGGLKADAPLSLIAVELSNSGVDKFDRRSYLLSRRTKDKPDGQSRSTFAETGRRAPHTACVRGTIATLGHFQASLARMATRVEISKRVITKDFSSKEGGVD